MVALERLGAEPYDLMLLDLDMPRLAGYEVLTHARRQVATSTLPVIVLTGSSNSESEVEVIEHGADDYLRKPIDLAASSPEYTRPCAARRLRSSGERGDSGFQDAAFRWPLSRSGAHGCASPVCAVIAHPSPLHRTLADNGDHTRL